MTRLHAVLLVVAACVSARFAQAQAPSSSAPAASAAPSAQASGAPSPPDLQRQAAAFIAKCSGCHTVGGGALQGPDLLPATQWTDAQLRPAIKLMEKRVGPLSNEDLDGFVSLLRDPAVRDHITSAQRASMQSAEANLDRPSPSAGAALFYGRQPLANQGLACSTCHQAAGQGGSLGPDLTEIAAKLSGPPLVSAVRNASFNVMRAAYRDHPITQQEALHVAAFLESVKAAPTSEPGSRSTVLGAVLGVLAMLALVFALRPAGGARGRLLGRALRK